MDELDPVYVVKLPRSSSVSIRRIACLSCESFDIRFFDDSVFPAPGEHAIKTDTGVWSEGTSQHLLVRMRLLFVGACIGNCLIGDLFFFIIHTFLLLHMCAIKTDIPTSRYLVCLYVVHFFGVFMYML